MVFKKSRLTGRVEVFSAFVSSNSIKHKNGSSNSSINYISSVGPNNTSNIEQQLQFLILPKAVHNACGTCPFTSISVNRMLLTPYDSPSSLYRMTFS